MIISDLGYLEIAGDEILGGRRRRRADIDGSINIRKRVDIRVNVYETYDKAIFGVVDVHGNLATAEAGADASGYNSFAETITFTDATPYSSEAYSGSVSGSN